MKNPFQGMTKREIMIEIGQISEDETWENDIFFNISLELVGKQSSRLVDTILLDFKDKINSKYLKLYKKQLRVILANLFTANSINEDLFVVYSRDKEYYKKSNRYNPNRISYRPLIFLVDNLKEHGWIKNILGSQKKGKRSKMSVTHKLKQAFKDYKIASKYLQSNPMDCVRLKDKSKKLIEYKDNSATHSMRSKLHAYNNLLFRTNIKLIRNKKVSNYLEIKPTNFNNTEYHRVFNDSSFELGGRFYGPWWVNLSKDIRKYITINNNKNVELDYSSLNIHLLYSEEGINYYDLNDNTADPYILKGIDRDERDINKLIITIALNITDKHKFVYAVKGAIEEDNDENYSLGNKKKLKVPIAKEIWKRLRLFEKANAPIKHHLFTGVGKRLQFKDSCIAEKIIEHMVNNRIPILSIHDSFIVESKNKSSLLNLMNHMFGSFKLISIPIIK
ncbi:hypothetical protein [Candidatus Pelagibacter sp. HIMB1746]|uniref:hypothetical protein n=1 Tax=Candidatus Pelagibacter sp. HIMB1746 TaxID=3413370 RepID=UPI003F85FE25